MARNTRKSRKAAAADRSTRKAKRKDKQPLFDKGFWRRRALPALVLFALGLGLYLQTVHFDYNLDDKLVITQNEFTQKGLAGIPDLLFKESFSGFPGYNPDLIAGARYRPLSLVTFALEYELFGLRPDISHFVNALLYALTLLLVLRILVLFLPEKGNPWLSAAFAGAVLFALHPVHTEVVSNIKGRDELLALLFALGTLYYALRHAATRHWQPLAASAVLMFLGMMSKENAITYLAVVPLAQFVLLRASWRTMLRTTAILLLPVLAYLWLRVEAIGYLFKTDAPVQSLMNNPFVEATLEERMATIIYTLGLYVKLLFFPHPLTHDYYPYHIPLMHWTDWQVWASLALYAAMTWWAIRELPRRTVPSFAILYFLATISIVSNIFFPVGTFMNERFLYMPSLAFPLFFGWFAFRQMPKWLEPRQPAFAKWSPLALSALFALGFAWKSIDRIPDWRNEFTLNKAAIQVSKNSARANTFYAYTLYRMAVDTADVKAKRQLITEAEPYVDKALSIYPQYPDALRTKAGIRALDYQLTGNLDQLLADFAEVARKDWVDFLDTYMKYLNGRAPAQKLLPFYHRVGYEIFFLEKGDLAHAIQYLQMGLELDPQNPQLLKDLALVYARSSNARLALQYAQAALSANPGDEELLELLRQMSGQ